MSGMARESGAQHGILPHVPRLAPVGDRTATMYAPDPTCYRLLGELLKALLGPRHATTVRALHDLVWALLLSQSVHPAALARALPALETRRARQALRRVRRLQGNPALQSAALTPWLLRAALTVLPAGEVVLVLDSTRCGGWEVFTLGLAWDGRVLPIAWRALPYPWPKKQFTPTVLALLDATLAVWPATRPVHLVADRGFPSLPLFRRLEQWRAQLPLGYSIRLRASDWVRDAAGQPRKVGDQAVGLAAGDWHWQPASYQRRGHASPAAHLAVGWEAAAPPAHQRGPADQARRAARAQRRRAHVQSKQQAPHADRVWAVLSTAPSAAAAVTTYGRRFTTEGTYRDLKTWQLEAVVAHETAPAQLDGLLGLAALTYWVQATSGAQAGRGGDAACRARQQQWCTTDRLSSFWRGRQVLHDGGFDWRSRLTAEWTRLTRWLTWDPIPDAPRALPAAPPTRWHRPARAKEAA